MIQTSLPFFPEETTLINSKIGVLKKGDTVFYFNGSMPVFHHYVNDYSSFRQYTSQLVVMGICKQMDIVRCFAVSRISVKRWVKKYRSEGNHAFFQKKK